MKLVVIAICGVVLLSCYAVLYLASSGGLSPSGASALEQVAATDTPVPLVYLPATYTPPAPQAEIGLRVNINIALSDYEYEQEQVLVKQVETRGEELVILLRRLGTPSTVDYFAQLDIIHGIVLEESPDVEVVRTIDIAYHNGFAVLMDDLLDYSQDQMDYDEYRNRWQIIGP